MNLRNADLDAIARDLDQAAAALREHAAWHAERADALATIGQDYIATYHQLRREQTLGLMHSLDHSAAALRARVAPREFHQPG